MSEQQCRRLPVLSALVILISALFALVPAVEAGTCSTDVSGATSVQIADIPVDGERGNDADGCLPGSCAHGHCHASVGLPPIVDGVEEQPVPVAGTEASLDRSPDSIDPDGPSRPPRA